jgi:hypothetical protein
MYVKTVRQYTNIIFLSARRPSFINEDPTRFENKTHFPNVAICIQKSRMVDSGQDKNSKRWLSNDATRELKSTSTSPPHVLPDIWISSPRLKYEFRYNWRPNSEETEAREFELLFCWAARIGTLWPTPRESVAVKSARVKMSKNKCGKWEVNKG